MKKINKIIIYILLILNFNLESNINKKNKYLEKTNEYLIKINKFLEKNGSKILKISLFTAAATYSIYKFYDTYILIKFNKFLNKQLNNSDLYEIKNIEKSKYTVNTKELILSNNLKKIFNINKNIFSIIYKNENCKIKKNNSNNFDIENIDAINYKLKLNNGNIIDIKKEDFNNFKNLIHDFKIYNFLYNYTDIKNNSNDLNKINKEIAKEKNQENINLINQYAK